MDMIQDIPWHLLEKHFAEETNGNEEKQIKDWIETTSENLMIYDQLKSYYQITGSLPIEFKPDAKAALEKVSLKLSHTKNRAPGISVVWYAAASVVIIFACFWLFRSHAKIQSKPILVQYTTDSISSITLADGSRVWLNTGSTLEYPKQFGATREVNLSGEGYFEIVHDLSHPFLVHTQYNVIKDLGTKFDVRSFDDEETSSVMVTEGSVSFANHHNKLLIIKLNQMSRYHKKKEKFEPVSLFNPNFLAWKTREFVFDDTPLCDVFQTISSVYNFRYEFVNKDAMKLKINTQFKSLSLTDITSILSVATKINIVVKKDDNQRTHVTIY